MDPKLYEGLVVVDGFFNVVMFVMMLVLVLITTVQPAIKLSIADKASFSGLIVGTFLFDAYLNWPLVPWWISVMGHLLPAVYVIFHHQISEFLSRPRHRSP